MFEINFNQANMLKGILFAIGYVVLVVVLLSVIFSPIEIIDYVNDGMTKVELIGIAILILMPVIFLKKIASDRGRFVLKNQKIYLEINKKKTSFDIAQIGMFIFKDGPRKTLMIYALDGRVLANICPVIDNRTSSDIIEKIITEILKHTDFKVSTKKEKAFGHEYLVTIYNK